MIDLENLDWAKGGGLLPAIIQDTEGRVRMLGYMDRAALAASLQSGFVTFFSRSKNRLWTKGETSGNRLRLHAIAPDCDRDALLVTADAEGPTCHTGEKSCFASDDPFFPVGLERVIADRATADPADSYTACLFAQGVRRIAQKVGEEGVEVALAATAGNRAELASEVADLAYHLTLLLSRQGVGWKEVGDELKRRHRDKAAVASS